MKKEEFRRMLLLLLSTHHADGQPLSLLPFFDRATQKLDTVGKLVRTLQHLKIQVFLVFGINSIAIIPVHVHYQIAVVDLLSYTSI